jgi:hypothetical protein
MRPSPIAFSSRALMHMSMATKYSSILLRRDSYIVARAIATSTLVVFFSPSGAIVVGSDTKML